MRLSYRSRCRREETSRMQGEERRQAACVSRPERYTRNQFSEEEKSMCDYSLAGLPNRLAVEGEQLVVYRFRTGAIGLASSCLGLKHVLFPSSVPAVCIPPGARLRLHDIPPWLQQRLGVGEIEEVAFVQQSAEAFTYRDAVRFANGKELLLQFLRCGQSVDVLSLSS